MTPEELAERIWDKSYMSLDEIKNDLRELYNEGWVVGYTEATDKMKEPAKKPTRERR